MVYNSETITVEESIHVKSDDKEPDYDKSELVKGFVNLQVFEEYMMDL